MKCCTRIVSGMLSFILLASNAMGAIAAEDMPWIEEESRTASSETVEEQLAEGIIRQDEKEDSSEEIAVRPEGGQMSEEDIALGELPSEEVTAAVGSEDSAVEGSGEQFSEEIADELKNQQLTGSVNEDNNSMSGENMMNKEETLPNSDVAISEELKNEEGVDFIEILSFSKEEDIKILTEKIDCIDDTKDNIKFSYPVYICKNDYIEEFDIKLSLISDGYEEAQMYSKSFKISTYKIKMYSYIPALILSKGTSIKAAVQLEKNGEEVEKGASFIIVSSDSNVVSVENVDKEADGTFFSIKGVAEGKAVITVTETMSGTVYSTTVQVNSGILVYNARALPKYYDRDSEYNGYIDGMYIDSFSSKKGGGAGGGGGGGGRNALEPQMEVSFTVYNTTNANGAVDVYDANGDLIKSVMIKKFDGGYITSIKDTAIAAYKIFEDIFTGNMLTYKQDSYSQQTKVKVDVPMGGRIEITNNSTYSNTCAIYNSVDFIITSTFLLGDVIKLTDSDAKKVSEKTAEKLVSGFFKTYGDAFPGNTASEKISQIGERFVQKIAKKTTNKLLKSGMQEGVASFISEGRDILEECDIDLEKIILSSASDVGISIAEDALQKAMSIPGSVMGGMFAINKYLSYAAFYIDIFTPHSNKAFIVYFDDENDCLQDGGVSIKAEDGTTILSDDNYVMHSIVISNDTDLSDKTKESLDKISDKYMVRNIYMEKNGANCDEFWWK